MDRQRLTRVLDVVEHLATAGPCTVTEVSTALGTPLSSTHDLLTAMVETGVAHVADRAYGLGPRAIRTALAVMDGVGVVRVAQRPLERLAGDTGFDVYLATRAGSRVVYTSRAAGRQRVNLDIPLGRSLLLHATAVGKLFAAHDAEVHAAMMTKHRPAVTSATRTDAADLEADLARVRAKGVSISRGESILDVLGVATPVRDAAGQITAAVHVSALRTALPARELTGVVARMRETSAEIEGLLAAPTAAATVTA